MLDAFLRYIEENELAFKNQKIIIAVSGGVDSMVLTHLFSQSSFECAIAHCNFQLRGKESDEEQLLVQETAEKIGIPLFTKKFDTLAQAKESGSSIQMVARELRYDWFEELLEMHDYTLIATAHHLNDNLETAIFNFTKGTGLSGLRGIPIKNRFTIRPLLWASRDEIISYATKNQIQWLEDSSNKETKYARNRIRKNVIPELKKINPAIEETTKTSMHRLAKTEAFVKYATSNAAKSIVEKKGKDTWIDQSTLKVIPGCEVLLYEFIKEFGFSYLQSIDIIRNHDESGKIYFGNGFVLNIDRHFLIVSPQEEFYDEISIEKISEVIILDDHKLIFETFESEEISIKQNENIAQFDMDQLNLPFCLRKWRPGDTFYPLGMSHKKKLSDFMIDAKIPVNLKSRIYVLCSKEDIFWVVGHRIDNRFKITSKTKRVLQITKIPMHD